jgi:GNAT superfamily N-acetyltransferase
MAAFERQRGPYRLTTDKDALQIEVIHDYLSRDSYWAAGRPLETVRRSIEHSLCFSIFFEDSQVGFARVVTDRATFAWVCDVFVLEAHRRRGLGQWLVESVVSHPDLAGLRLTLLATRDAHGLYERYGGFAALEEPGRWLARWNRSS